ncbi:50S ribosomal protein L10 [Candidatus Saccharibacteria bacterium]|nr:50S ribosomal protein L10 [Candidatus Saccharibacteria bacterium]MBI2285622.1 50S ribosomal protein L10 [Candidatus Saccharibacteria bacterium]
MALSKERKQETVKEVQDLLAGSKTVVFARYQGTPVRSMQELRLRARSSGTVVRVIKNRLFKKALASTGNFKDIDVTNLRGQLLYAFNEADEVAPAQNLASFAMTNPQIEFVGAITEDGELLSADDVKTLASLPTKDQLRAQLVATIQSPLTGVVSAVAGNIRGVLSVLNARAEKLGS